MDQPWTIGELLVNTFPEEYKGVTAEEIDEKIARDYDYDNGIKMVLDYQNREG